MSKVNFDELLTATVDSVLETMFFSFTDGPAEPEIGSEVLESRLAFQGCPSGTFGVCLSKSSARLLAAGFLGEDEETLTDSQTGQMVCELANMLCGSLLSKLQSDESFDLASPVLVSCENEVISGPAANYAARQSFEIEKGILTATLHLEEIL